MRPTPTRSAIVTRISPEGATLARSTGTTITVGATVTDGEALTLATPTGDGGAVSLDRRGVALRLTTVRLPAPAAPVSVYESGFRISTDAALPMVGSIGVRALSTPEAAPPVKPAPPPPAEDDEEPVK